MTQQKNQAERLRIGVSGGWVPVQEAIAWADQEIERARQPHSALLDLASASNRHRHEVASLLDAVPGTADRLAVMRACLADLLEVVEHKPWLAADVATWIEAAAFRGELAEADFGWEPFALADEFALAAQGTFGTANEARGRLVAFLRNNGRREA